MRRHPNPGAQRGQALPLFALLLVVLLAAAALAIDVSGAYAARRFYRSAADAAALAGAQDLQGLTTRNVTATDRIDARTHAMQSLTQELSISGPLPAACSTSTDADVTDACVFPGTSYHVSIKTPAPACDFTGTCDSTRSVQVSLRNADYQLSLARVLGQSSWNVGVTSVAGLAYPRSYAIMTLRPPKAAGSTFLVNDITLNGNNTVVNVYQGDVGSNANMTYSGNDTVLNLDSGYGMYYFDPYFPPKWYPSAPIPPNQVVQQLSSLIADPNYAPPYPAMSGSVGPAPTFDDARASKANQIPAVSTADQNAACASAVQSIDTSHYKVIASTPLSSIYCYKPGIYQSGSGSKNATITVNSGDVGILLPGVYYLKSGMNISGSIIGGWEPGSPGVALMFDEAGPSNCPSCALFVNSANSGGTVALNAGTKFPPGSVSGVAATAAIDWNGQKVQTSGSASPTPPLLITLLVKKDTGGAGGTQACTVPTSPPYIEPSGCQDAKNQTIQITGGGHLDLEGVQYAPTDNVVLAGSSDGNGTVGQVIAWTVTYSGGTTLNQQGPGFQGEGTLRLDEACTTPDTTSAACNP